MPDENIFKDRSIISLIPFLTGLYLGYINPADWLIPALLVVSTIVFYLIVMYLAKEVTKKNPKSENDIYRTVVNRENFKTSGIVSIMQWLLSLVCLYLLYPHLQDLIAYTLFWLLIIGFLFNLLQNFIVNFDVIKDGFQGKFR